jgi:hypothetical protein
MTIEQAALAIFGAALGVMGWFARVLYEAVQKLQRDLNILEVRIGTDYIRYDRLQDTMRPVMEALEEIKRALSNKADK